MNSLRWISIIIVLLSFNQQINAQDWPELNRFREQNMKLGLPQKGEQRIVFMGNSITEGWPSHDPDFFSKPGYINRGIGGQTTPQMLLRFRADVIDLKPKAVLILAGTNDIAGNTGPMTLEEIRDNIISMAELAKVNDIEVIICSVLPAFDYSWRPGMNPNIKIPELNEMLKNYADENALIYLDYFSAMADEGSGLPPELARDGVHPTKEGYAIMRGLAEKAIQSALKQ